MKNFIIYLFLLLVLAFHFFYYIKSFFLIIAGILFVYFFFNLKICFYFVKYKKQVIKLIFNYEIVKCASGEFHQILSVVKKKKCKNIVPLI